MAEADFPAHPRIAIIGSGAVGCYYGGRLAQHGEDVHFLMRSDLDAVRKRGLEVRSVRDSFHLPAPQVYARTEDIGPCDLVIIALKTTSNHLLPQLLPPLLGAHTLILTLQNGLGNETFLAQRFGAERVIGGICFVCINRIAPGVIDHQAQGQVTVGEIAGPPLPRTRAIAALFEKSQVPCRAATNLMTERWKKLVWNIPYNGLPIAAGGIDTAAIMQDPELRALTEALMHEVVNAARALGHTLPDDVISRHLEATLGMGPYWPSSVLDFLAGREVEVTSIWGEPLRLAQEAGVATPRLAMLHALLRSQTAQATKKHTSATV